MDGTSESPYVFSDLALSRRLEMAEARGNAGFVEVRAAQLTGTNGLVARGPLRCRARAQTSLPVPVSPEMSTVHSTSAARKACCATRRIERLWPTTQSATPWPSDDDAEATIPRVMEGC